MTRNNHIAVSRICFLLAVMLFSTEASATENFAGDFLMRGAGTRSLSMGNSAVAVVSDATSAYYNPAGLAQLKSYEINLMHSEQFAGLINYNTLSFGQSGITPGHIIELLKMIHGDEITVKAGQKVMEELAAKPRSPKRIIEDLGLAKIKGEDVVESAVEEAIKENQEAVKDYLDGKEEALNFIVGQVMRKTRGRADPQVVHDKIEKILKRNM